jgi:hypothetical protein
MRMIVLIVATVLFLFSGQQANGGEQDPPAKTELLTKNEAKEIDALISRFIKAGFPDATGATVYSGKLVVTAALDPGWERLPLPMRAVTTNVFRPDSAKTIVFSYEFDGLHFKLADGSWVIALAYWFRPKPGDRVTPAGGTQVDLATLTASAAAEQPFDAEKTVATRLDAFGKADRPKLAASMNILVPVTFKIKLDVNYLAPGIVLLYRAGWPDAAAAAVSVADQRATGYLLLQPWTGKSSVFDPTGAYENARAEMEAWAKAHATKTLEEPPVALRRALFLWCRNQMMAQEPEDALLSLKVAAAVARAAVDPGDPQRNAASIKALLAGMRLPIVPPKGADLAHRLQSWELNERQPRMVVGGSGGGNSVSGSTSFVNTPAAYVPVDADLDKLMTLLADKRPSRFVDFTGPRTLGDNSWRAVARLLKADPRTLAGYPTDKPWTNEERRAAAAAVQKWFKQHRSEYVKSPAHL